MEPQSPEPTPTAAPPPPAPLSPSSWWSPRRPWLPLILTLVIGGSASFVTLRLVQDRRDLQSEVGPKEERIKELNETVKEQALQIEKLEEQAGEASGSGQDCTLAAETGVEVLTAFIQVVELVSQGDRLQAQEEYADMKRLAGDFDRTTESCIARLRAIGDEEAELF